jgi:hypothetical protein
MRWASGLAFGCCLRLPEFLYNNSWSAPRFHRFAIDKNAGMRSSGGKLIVNIDFAIKFDACGANFRQVHVSDWLIEELYGAFVFNA